MNSRVQLTWMLAALLLSGALSGCASRRSSDLLEARLREQEDALYAQESELQSANTQLSVAQRELSSLRQQLVERGDAVRPAEESRRLFAATGIQINKLRTGGIDQDNQPGDDVLTAVIVPHDAQGETVKVAGELQIRLFDLSKPVDQQMIGQWKFDPEQTSENWHRGLLGAGYVFRLPWQRAPQSSELLLHARLTTDDGRKFDISEPINVAVADQNTRLANISPSNDSDIEGDLDFLEPVESGPTVRDNKSGNQKPGESAGIQLVDDEQFGFEDVEF